MGKYDGLAGHLSRIEEGQHTIELNLSEIDKMCGGLPASAFDQRTWWANNSHIQATAWRSAGWHVDTVDLSGGRVRFVRGCVGGTHASRMSRTTTATSAPVGEVVAEREVVVRMAWRSRGEVALGTSGLVFPVLGVEPGLYRLELCGGREGGRKVYIGETHSLNKRMKNYRRPPSGAQTSVRINDLLVRHLGSAGAIRLATCTEAKVVIEGKERPADLQLKRERVLVEHAALIQEAGAADIELANL
jgi:hypothetical protein